MSLKIIGLCMVVIGFLAAPLWAQTPSAEDAAQWRRAEYLLQKGQGEEAYPIYAELLSKFPGHNALLLGRARSAALSRRLDEAEAIYRDLLEKYPRDPILLNERDQVLALKAGATSATFFSLRLRAGYIYDSNANQGAESDVVQVFPNLNNLRITFRDTKKIASSAAYFGANLDFSRRLPSGSPWSFVADSSFYIRGNEDSALKDLKNSEWQWYRLGAGLRYAKGQNLFEFRVKGEVFDYELTNHVLSWGPEITYLRAVVPTFHLISQLSLDIRNYQRNPDRDGTYGQVAQYGRIFFGQNVHSLTFGAAYLWGRPKMDSLGHNGYAIPVRLTLRPHEDWEISPNATYTYERYKGPAIVLDTKDRRDKKFRTGVDFIYKLNDNWRVEVNYSHNRDNSNSPLYDYTQDVIGVGLSWGF